MKLLRNISAKDLRGKTALVRIDVNTADEWRFAFALPTLQFLLRRGARIVIVSHRGRPKGIDPKLSLRSVSPVISRALGRKVIFIPHFRFAEIAQMVRNAEAGSVFLLENIRFLRGEKRNDPKLGKALASLGDIYVNDAFSVCHRAQASVSVVPRYLKSYAGFCLEKEIVNLLRIMDRPRRPFVVVVGGAKAESKWGVIERFGIFADAIVLGGAPAHTVLKVQGMDIGKSIWDPAGAGNARSVADYPSVILPVDFVRAHGEFIDIGIKSVKLFRDILRSAGTIIWNGPFGLTEEKRFSKGTLGIARAIAANRRAFSVAGGGETVMFLKKHKLDKKFSFISTGGGAMLVFLAGRRMPGIAALEGAPAPTRRRGESLATGREALKRK